MKKAHQEIATLSGDHIKLNTAFGDLRASHLLSKANEEKHAKSLEAFQTKSEMSNKLLEAFKEKYTNTKKQLDDALAKESGDNVNVKKQLDDALAKEKADHVKFNR